MIATVTMASGGSVQVIKVQNAKEAPARRGLHQLTALDDTPAQA